MGASARSARWSSVRRCVEHRPQRPRPEDWGADHGQGPLAARIARTARELAREVERRETPVVAHPYDDPEPFEHLLSGK
ncbi:hypothetical protein [Streptomyces sp. V1I6]|uniref:hypothetical protein n=1 Tax=Streptomyces sp. V1I6 TaxID=3042273 RepID=UPI00278754FD|nr:hypothetical protein [Streptomyces sp. V1I6]MDQ0841409.1 hypothetical protein [Streptomyces sp. V1I6]